MLVDSQKIALITGGAIRVGKCLTESLAKDGWKIALHYNKSEKEAVDLAKKLLPITDVILFQADLTKQQETASLISKINNQLGPVSLIINNASIYNNDSLFNLSPDKLEEHMHIHLNAPLYLAQAMHRQGFNGNIINIIDTEVTHNLHKFFSYSLSKKSLLSLTKMLAVNLAPRIRVNAIAPGPLLFKEGQDAEIFQQLIDESPLKIKAELDELYNAVKFLVNSSSITGQILFLDGGRHLL